MGPADLKLMIDVILQVHNKILDRLIVIEAKIDDMNKKADKKPNKKDEKDKAVS